MKKKIPEYPPISIPYERHALASNSCMPRRPYHELPILNFFLWGPSIFLVVGSTWTTGLSAPIGLVANDLSRVAFLVCFKVDDDCDAIDSDSLLCGEFKISWFRVYQSQSKRCED